MNRTTATALLFLLTWPTSLVADDPFNWTPAEGLDDRLPLEIAAALQLPPGDFINLPVLFDETVNSLDMVRVDLTQQPAGASPIVIATGSIFALGPAVQLGDRVGSSFVDGSFDLRFGGCDAPCATTFNLPVNVGTWIDSSSAASSGNLFVAGLDNGADHEISLFHSTTNGWQLLNSYAPGEPGGVYDNFHGGKRIQVIVDPLATDPATTRNCLFFETRPAPGTTTALHLKCNEGIVGVFDTTLDTDVPNPLGMFDRTIETACLPIRTSLGQLETLCTYTHRQTLQIRAVHVDDAGKASAPVTLGPVPAGADFYKTAAVPYGDFDEVGFTFPVQSEMAAMSVHWNRDAGSFAQTAPEFDPGPVSASRFTSDIIDPRRYLFGVRLAFQREGVGEGFLVMSRGRVPIFFDGFETQNLLRWSNHVP